MSEHLSSRLSFRSAATPLILLVLTLGSIIGSRTGILPAPSDILNAIRQLLETGGAWAIAAVSLVENIIGVNTYFPGSIVILSSMAATAGDVSLALKTWFAISIGAILGQCLSWRIGRTMRTGVTLQAPSLWAYVIAFWHPQVGAIVSLRAGQAQCSIGAHLRLLIPVLIAWNVFWGIAMYNLGATFFVSTEGEIVFVAILIGWCLWELRPRSET